VKVITSMHHQYGHGGLDGAAWLSLQRVWLFSLGGYA